MARKNHKRPGREARQRRQDRAAARLAEWDSMTALEASIHKQQTNARYAQNREQRYTKNY